MCWRKILEFFRKMKAKTPVAKGVEAKKPTREKESPYPRIILTRRGGPNMPRRQPCPKCKAPAKRSGKTMGGAYYFHKKCDCGFFVKEGGK